MKKRYVLAALAAMTVLAGCGDNASQQKNTDNTTQESTTEDDLTAADPDEDGEELDPEFSQDVENNEVIDADDAEEEVALDPITPSEYLVQNASDYVTLGDYDGVEVTRYTYEITDDLTGYEIQKKKLVDNTEAFVQGKVANNCLLYGDAGTGKSTSIKAILNQYYGDGLRMIEIYKHQFKYLSAIISHIKNRNYRFIIYMDDLSFEEFEIEYKYLKAVIEGGMETKPDNVLIYATSNRRHLIRETWSDRSDKDEELHRSDTVQEKLSLAARFGVSINYSKPTQQEYFQIVTNLAKKYPEITMSDKELCAEANKWELSHGGISGRTAQQFINYIAGKSDK